MVNGGLRVHTKAEHVDIALAHELQRCLLPDAKPFVSSHSFPSY